jgi:DNA-binding NarL/FixJ family response regulator
VAETILIADHHPVFCETLENAVLAVRPDAQVLRAASMTAARSVIARMNPRLVLLDLTMPDCRGFVGLVTLRQDFPNIAILIVSTRENEAIVARAHAFGAQGFLPKNASRAMVEAAVRDILAEREYWPSAAGNTLEQNAGHIEEEMAQRLFSLTPAQLRILIGLTEGLLNKQIAFEMQISEATVKAHVTAVFRKLNVASRTQAVIAARALQVPTDSGAQNY